MTMEAAARMRRWQTKTIHFLAARGHGMVLMVNIIARYRSGPWYVTALETTNEVAGDFGHGIEHVFDKHAHAMIGETPTRDEAKRLAERYVNWWQGSRAVSFECACGEIETADSLRAGAG
jgi:hypothetical protein